MIVIYKDNKLKLNKKKAKVSTILKELEINPQTVIVKYGRNVVTEEDWISGEEVLEIIAVVSRG